MNIVPVTSDDLIGSVESIANVSWNETYDGIVSKAQIDHMLKTLQSFDEIKRRIDSGERYFIIRHKNNDAGYVAVNTENGDMFLSKIYILSEFQRRGLATFALDHIIEICKKEGIRRIYLRVNRKNSNAIAFYLRSGFTVERDDVKDIGNGFVADDHIMERMV